MMPENYSGAGKPNKRASHSSGSSGLRRMRRALGLPLRRGAGVNVTPSRVNKFASGLLTTHALSGACTTFR
jgi:hypothetical protein